MRGVLGLFMGRGGVTSTDFLRECSLASSSVSAVFSAVVTWVQNWTGIGKDELQTMNRATAA